MRERIRRVERGRREQRDITRRGWEFPSVLTASSADVGVPGYRPIRQAEPEACGNARNTNDESKDERSNPARANDEQAAIIMSRARSWDPCAPLAASNTYGGNESHLDDHGDEPMVPPASETLQVAGACALNLLSTGSFEPKPAAGGFCPIERP